MAELDGHVGLVERADIVCLVEQLLERDARRPLPVTVVYGPGGSGKSAVITHLERYFNANTPLAKVELTQDSSKSSQDVLDAIFFRLCRDSHKQFGKLRLPRYETARIIRACAAETAAVPKQHLTLRRRLAEQLTLSPLTESVREGGEVSAGVAGFFGRALRPVTRWMYGAAVIAPQPLRRLLAGPKFAAAFRWYEREVPALLQGAPEDVHVDNIGVHIHGLINDEPVSDATRDQLNRFTVAALLADLRAEYRSRRLRGGQVGFTSFGTSRAGWKRAEPPLQVELEQQRFFSTYGKMMRTHRDSFRTPSNGHVVASYDALGLLLDAGLRAGSARQPVPTRAEVYHALRATTGTEAHFGASGVIDFGPVPPVVDRAGADPVRKFVSVQRVTGLRGDLRTEHVTAFGVRQHDRVK